MTQALYAHMINKRKKINKKNKDVQLNSLLLFEVKGKKPLPNPTP
jgi:hypothetical protein